MNPYENYMFSISTGYVPERRTRSHEFCLYIKPDKKFLPRLMNATLNDELFFSIANHMLTVVDVDAFYVKPDVPRRELLHEGKVWWYTTR